MAVSINVFAARSYDSHIKQVQATSIDGAYNSIHLTFDVVDSPCASTNASNRFNITNEVQQAAALAALMANKKIQLMPTGQCNAAGIETINYILIRANQ